MKTLEQILAKAKRDILPEIIAKTHELKRLQDLFYRFLSADLIDHCKLAKIEDGKLHVVVDSAVWAARLRYAIPDIVKNLKLQPEFKDIGKIQYHIDMEATAPTRKLQKNKLSDVNEKLWRQTMLGLRTN